MPIIEEQPTPVFTCPTWCTVDHEADGYLRHGHVIHRTNHMTPRGYVIEFWQSTVCSYREDVEPVEVHLEGGLFTKFDDPENLRIYAEDLLGLADTLDEMNGYTPRAVGRRPDADVLQADD